MINNKTLFILSIVLFFNMQIFANNRKQQLEGLYKNNIVQTPEMAQLIRNIQYPVNYSTGTINIEIPLFTISCGTLNIPFNLTYDTSGVKVSSLSGIVGQNWTLHGVPTISRKVNGHIDYHFECNFDPNLPYANTAFWGYEHIKNLLNECGISGNDEEPDEYYYSIPDESGMFIYCLQPQEGYPRYMSVPYDNLKIEPNTSKKYFILTDKQGTIYTFNGTTDHVSDISGDYDCGWKASTVKAANGIDSIKFDYSESSHYLVKTHNDSYTIVDNIEAMMLKLKNGYSLKKTITGMSKTNLDTWISKS